MKRKAVLLFFWFIILLTNCVIQLWMLIEIVFNTDRAVSMAIAYDRLGNAAMGQGDKETISSWSGRKDSWQEKVIDKLFNILTGEVNHCDNNREV